MRAGQAPIVIGWQNSPWDHSDFCSAVCLVSNFAS